MLIVAERLNSTRKAVARAIAERDVAFVREETRRQAEAGADYIDINVAAAGGDEVADMEWAVRAAQEATDLPLCVDSPNPAALAAGLAAHRGPPMVNSISGEQARMAAVLPLVKEHDAAVVALTIEDAGMPSLADDRVRIARAIVERLTSEGVTADRIYVDALVRAVSTEPMQGRELLDAMRRIRAEFPEAHLISGLSNISFGLPSRSLLNRTFLAMAVAAGMDAAILDPLDRRLMSAVCAAQALLGEDEFCMNYLTAHRAEALE
jgi:5-methyltetrahydrofolate--homocysteine methyltransferase